MKTTPVVKRYVFLTLSALLLCSIVYSQVGINTTTPNGILDVTSSNTGLILPRVNLTSTTVQSPVLNPQGGNIPIGTTVYNRNTSTNGTNDVTPGIYVWNGTRWAPQFTRKQSAIYEQTVMNVRTQSAGGYKTIPLSGTSFTANYTGSYRIELNVNFGGGDAKVPKISGGSSSTWSDGYLNIARMTGTFRLLFNGTPYLIPASSISTAYLGATNYFGIWKQFTAVFYVNLTANSVNSFSLGFDQDSAPEFIGNGNNNNGDGSFSGGDGHVGFDIPCRVEITYTGEQ
jgi:hypothetical protein